MSKKRPEQKNMSSIALSLHGQLVRTKLGLYISANFFLFIALSLMTLFQIEWNHFGTELPDKIIHWAEGDIDRILTTRGEGIRNLTYVVTSGKDTLINENVFIQFNIIISFIVVAVIFQCLNLIFAYYGEYRGIKKKLNPINEMAIRADEMSRMSFDEAKFHTIENAIEHISPEQTTEMSL